GVTPLISVSTRPLSQATTGVVREHRRVVAAEEDQMLGVLGGNDHQPPTQHLRGEAGTETVRVDLKVFGCQAW
ncbi:MAG TPA: hypothetical protein VK908_18265, partial [Jiangellales bacterium]|nr:hypothetical protein [Jiangellales bacterium]